MRLIVLARGKTMNDEVAIRVASRDAGSQVAAECQLANAVAENAIRLCAYQKWEAAGRPADDGAHFWLAAEKELARHQWSRSRKWWTHLRPWIVPSRLRFFRRGEAHRA